MPTSHIRILMVEDSPIDAELIQRVLRQGGLNYSVDRVETESDLRAALESSDPDVILSDYNLPAFDGIAALNVARELVPETPFIFVSGSIGEERAVQALREGAVDYILKDRPSRLPSAINRAIGQRRDRQLRLRAQEDLRRSEERYRYAANATSEVICDINIATGKMTFNEALSTVWGYEVSADELPIEWWFSRIHPDDNPRVVASFERALASTENRWSCEYRMQRDDGTFGYLIDQAVIIRDAEGTATRVICAKLDVTERVMSEIMIRHLSTQNEMVLKFAGEGIIATDVEGASTLVNPAAAMMFHCSIEELRGTRDLHNAFHGRRPDGTPFPVEECPMRQALREGIPRSGEDVFWSKDGNPFPVEYSMSPMLENGKVVGTVMVFRDITKRRRLEKQLEQANRVSSLGRVAATIAHEFNNVLMGIQPFAEVMRRSAADEKLQNAASQIMNSVARGKRVTQSVLRFTQPAEPAVQKVEIRGWLKGLVPELRALIGPRIEVQVSGGDRPATCLCDPAQLQQVVTNLVINARDAMPSVGRISLTIRDSRDRTEFPFGQIPEGMILISVADTGTGMSPEVMQDIFVPLFTTKNTGTGLGLAVAQQVIARHQGSIHVASKLGEGTTFYILLPAAAEEPARESAAAGSCARNGIRRVLIVDDDEVVASGISALLQSEGIDVRVVHRGGEAVTAAASFAPDAVLLDWSLSDIDGVEVFDQLRQSAGGLPIVFSTGHGDESSLEKQLAAPHVAFLRKPYDLDLLLETLNRVVSR